MAANLYIICGMTRQGKSRYAKAMLMQPSICQLPCLVFDYQNEYGDTYYTLIDGKRTMVKGIGLKAYVPQVITSPSQPMQLRSRFRGQFDDFKNVCCQKILVGNEAIRVRRGYTMLFDESTIFLKGGMPEDIRDLAVSRFHDQNNLIFVFHKLKTVPPDLMDLADFIILFNTFDTLQAIEKRFDDELVTEGFKRQKSKKKDGAPPTIINRKKGTIDGKIFNP